MALAERANDLYWNSDASVNRIADLLGLSKGSLYQLIEPFRSGVPCPEGDDEMVFPNRTARDKGFLACPGCGFEEEEHVLLARLGDDAEAGYDAVAGARTDVVQSAPALPVSRASTRMIAGTALLGVATGILVASLLRRR